MSLLEIDGKENHSMAIADGLPAQAGLKSMTIALKASNKDASGEEEIDCLRRSLQKMTIAKEERESLLQRKEHELLISTVQVRQLEELLKIREESLKKLEEELRKALHILDEHHKYPEKLCLTTLVESKRSGRASKKLRKPHKPFLLWLKDKRQEVCDANPTASIADLYAIMLKDWDEVSLEDKNHYKKLHDADWEKYLKSLKVASEGKTETDEVQNESNDNNIRQKAMSLLGQFLASKRVREGCFCILQDQNITFTDEALPKAEAKNVVKDEEFLVEVQNGIKQATLEKVLAPNQYPSAYLLYSMRQRMILPLNQPEMTHVQMNAIIAKDWKEMSAEEKEIWHQKAVTVKENLISDPEILRCIPVGLKVDNSLDGSKIENGEYAEKISRWMRDNILIRKSQEDQSIGRVEPDPDDPRNVRK